MSKEMTPERYFLLYAYPCAHIIHELGQISKDEVEHLTKIAIREQLPSRELLEKHFPDAVKRIQDLAKEMNKEPWTLEVLKEYFWKRHTRQINNNETGFEHMKAHQKDLCKLYKAQIIKTSNDALLVRYNRKERTVLNTLVPDAKIGDYVAIHYGFAVEKL